MAAGRGGARPLGATLSTVAQTAGTSLSDPAPLIGAPLLLAVLAMAACYVPARKSLRIDPATSLRQEQEMLIRLKSSRLDHAESPWSDSAWGRIAPRRRPWGCPARFPRGRIEI